MGKYAYGNERWAPECSHMQRMLAVISPASCSSDYVHERLQHVQQADCLAVAHASVLPSHQAHAMLTFFPTDRFSASSLIHADSM